jgi:hypothetical protein
MTWINSASVGEWRTVATRLWRTRLRYCDMPCWPVTALGHKREWLSLNGMSVLPSEADIVSQID